MSNHQPTVGPKGGTGDHIHIPPPTPEFADIARREVPV